MVRVDFTRLWNSIYNRLRFGGPRRLYRKRADIAIKFIQGSGIEIGALHNPLTLPPGVEVRYVDKYTSPVLRRHYPELQGEEIVHVDIVDDGESLNSIPGASQDFVIANHLLEHCQDPIGALASWLRVLRIGGVLFLSVPDKRYTFDRERPVTIMDHILRDWRERPAWSRMQHYEEWARIIDRVPEPQVMERASALARSEASIHFHVWRAHEFREFLVYCQGNLPYDFEIPVFQKNGIEIVAVLKRLDAASS